MKRTIDIQKVINYIGENFGLVVVLVFAFISIYSLIHTGFFPTHDGEYHIVRFYEFDKTLRDGNWYPVWASDLNYTFGVPLFNYVYPLPNYISSLFHFFGISFIDTFKINLILASIIGAVTSYLYGRERFGKWGGVLTSVFYTYAPYHFLDIYIRGSVGEVWALALFPLVLLLLDKTVKSYSLRTAVTASLFYALVIFSHNILAVMFTFFLLNYALFLLVQSKKKLKTAASFCIVFLGGFALSSVFTIPAILEQKYVTGLKVYNVFENFPEIYQLIIPSWGSGFSGQASLSQMSFQIGAANLLVIILIIAGLFKRKVKKELIIFYLIFFFFLCFMMITNSTFIWKGIRFIQYFQFPWRLLSLVILCCAVLAGSITVLYKSKTLYIVLLAIAILTTFSYAKAPYFWDRTDSHYITRENFIFGTNSIGNTFQTKWLVRQNKLPDVDKNLEYIFGNTTNRRYRVNIKNPKTIIFSIAYFPGWKGYLNSSEVEIINKEGKIGVNVPSGTHEIELILKDTKVRLAAKTISIFTFLLFLLILFKPTVLQYFYARRN
jgi:hypothetical protein